MKMYNEEFVKVQKQAEKNERFNIFVLLVLILFFAGTTTTLIYWIIKLNFASTIIVGG